MTAMYIIYHIVCHECTRGCYVALVQCGTDAVLTCLLSVQISAAGGHEEGGRGGLGCVFIFFIFWGVFLSILYL